MENAAPVTGLDAVILIAEADLSFSGTERKMLCDLIVHLGSKRVSAVTSELPTDVDLKDQLSVLAHIKERQSSIQRIVDGAEYSGNDSLRLDLCSSFFAGKDAETVLIWLGIAFYVASSDNAKNAIANKMKAVELGFLKSVYEQIGSLESASPKSITLAATRALEKFL